MRGPSKTADRPRITSNSAALEQAATRNFAHIVQHTMRLYAPGCSSVSAAQAHKLASSVAYALAQCADTQEARIARLATEQPLDLHRECLAKLDARLEQLTAQWRESITIMPPIRNVALRDTLASIGRVPQRYDKLFAAHEIPCDIQYQLSQPVNENLQGFDYLFAWLEQFRREAEWIAQFETESCIRTLEHTCPDYRGLHINLYDLLRPHESELKRKEH